MNEVSFRVGVAVGKVDHVNSTKPGMLRRPLAACHFGATDPRAIRSCLFAHWFRTVGRIMCLYHRPENVRIKNMSLTKEGLVEAMFPRPEILVPKFVDGATWPGRPRRSSKGDDGQAARRDPRQMRQRIANPPKPPIR